MTNATQGRNFRIDWNWETSGTILREGHISKLEVGDSLDITGFYGAGKHEFAGDGLLVLRSISDGLMEQIPESPDLEGRKYDYQKDEQEGNLTITRTR